MQAKSLKSIEEYESFLQTKLDGWEVRKRIAFAIGMSTRWFHCYQSFAKENDWGDPTSLKKILDYLWSHLADQVVEGKAIERCSQKITENTPHMDDFDAPESLAFCVMLKDALQCFIGRDQTRSAVQSAISGFHAVMIDCDEELEAQPKLWHSRIFQKELQKQLKLIEEIEKLSDFETVSIAMLRKKLVSKSIRGEASPEEAQGPQLLPNEAAFEKYRLILETDLKSPRMAVDFNESSTLIAMLIVGEWMGRYKRRSMIIKGEYGKLADQQAIEALIAKQKEMDDKIKEIPDWDEDSRSIIEFCLSNPLNQFDAKTILSAHAYGPSLRKLWFAGNSIPQSRQQGWERIIAWNKHRPVSWAKEDERKKLKLPYSTERIGDFLNREIRFNSNSSTQFPWQADVDGKSWKVCVNDFPEELMYSLIVDNEFIGSFHDWPKCWRRD